MSKQAVLDISGALPLYLEIFQLFFSRGTFNLERNNDLRSLVTRLKFTQKESRGSYACISYDHKKYKWILGEINNIKKNCLSDIKKGLAAINKEIKGGY